MSRLTDELSQLADLRERGLLTAEEFDAQKTKLLAENQALAPARASPPVPPGGPSSPASFLASTPGKMIALAGVAAIALLAVLAAGGGSPARVSGPPQPGPPSVPGQSASPPVAVVSAKPPDAAPQTGSYADAMATRLAQDAKGSGVLRPGKYACYTFSGGRLSYTFMDVLITGTNTYSSGGETFRFHQAAGNQIIFEDGPLAGHPASLAAGPGINLGATTCDLEK